MTGSAIDAIGLAVARDEQDIIEPFVRHNLQFLDAMIVVDNDSADATPQILRALAAEDARVITGRLPGFGQDQSATMTGLLTLARDRLPARFVLPLDADEFIWAGSRAAFLDKLDAIPAGHVGLLPWRTSVLSGDPVEAGRDPPRTLTQRRVTEVPQFYKVVVRNDAMTPAGVVVEKGAHRVRVPGSELLPDVLVDAVILAHVPTRSREQFIAKVTATWLLGLVRASESAGANGAPLLRRMRDAMFREDMYDDENLKRLSITFKQDPAITAEATRLERDPIDWRYERRFSTGAPMLAALRLARAWELSLTEPGRGHMPEFDDLDAAIRRLRDRAKAMLPEGCAP